MADKTRLLDFCKYIKRDRETANRDWFWKLLKDEIYAYIKCHQDQLKFDGTEKFVVYLPTVKVDDAKHIPVWIEQFCVNEGMSLTITDPKVGRTGCNNAFCDYGCADCSSLVIVAIPKI